MIRPSDSEQSSAKFKEYQEAVVAATELAQDSFGLEFTEQTRSNWLNAMLLIYYVDQALDSNSVSSVDMKAGLPKLFYSGVNPDTPANGVVPENGLPYLTDLNANLSPDQRRV